MAWGPNNVVATGRLGICGSVLLTVRIVGNEYAGGAAHAPQVGSLSGVKVMSKTTKDINKTDTIVHTFYMSCAYPSCSRDHAATQQ